MPSGTNGEVLILYIEVRYQAWSKPVICQHITGYLDMYRMAHANCMLLVRGSQFTVAM